MKIRALIEGFRSSLFFLPSLFLVGAVVASQALVALDRGLSPDAVPDLLRSSVDGARDVLSTIAGATITVASVVFSVTVVALQLASSQFSPRILRGFLRNRFHQTVIGVVMATFTFSLLVLRSVRSASSGESPYRASRSRSPSFSRSSRRSPSSPS